MRSKVDLAALYDDVARLAYHSDGTGIMMAFHPCRGLPPMEKYPSIFQACLEISALRGAPAMHVMVNDVPEKHSVPVHVDPYPGRRCVERWHLPVATNPGSWLWQRRNGRTHPELGVWTGPVYYWQPHQVGNDGLSRRIHLVVDLDLDVAGQRYED